MTLQHGSQNVTMMDMRQNASHFDEMADPAGGERGPYGTYGNWFQDQAMDHLHKKSRDSELFFRRTGITFNVYGQQRPKSG